MRTANSKEILISGASFAGLSTAYWMVKFGYNVTIVEMAKEIKKGGTPVNIMGRTIDIVKRMGLFDEIYANRLQMESISFKGTNDETLRLEYHQKAQEEHVDAEYEIERDVLLQLMYNAVKDQVKFIFGDGITGLIETTDQVEVSFKNRTVQRFDLIFGCDGIHSAVRKHWFGEEKEFSYFLQTYFSISIVDELLIPENTTQLYSEPGRTVMLNAYNNKTDICLAFFSEPEIPYDYRNEGQMREIIQDAFKNTGWRTQELLVKIENSSSFYFDKLCQMKMASWTKGRVALVGDAGYCASPAAGRGGSLAIDGAAALADAIEKHRDDIEAAFREYNDQFRPFIDQVQAEVVDFGMDVLIPKTEEAIQKRNREGFGF
ncbi:FAD-dependent monooxygenase [Pedobacter duraquae]|uniref:2-polyprenyl-6-methoxyphenol hydroxylase-like FAD-dependent oxidoreductase n=1 Tax=Pedobacter duraquae TaxID=425511 RepID=A0A4V3C367_9SPHI|nr:FAD-dependent monooxygenase [Pedobacter duraquae]TDO20859.1 2-polyprenyl-6-methoxyphenol hydroxylase-like FAD-dependent oxidoreductase [Pedobacter duraquae]